jgi:hypothetical protein
MENCMINPPDDEFDPWGPAWDPDDDPRYDARDDEAAYLAASVVPPLWEEEDEIERARRRAA